MSIEEEIAEVRRAIRKKYNKFRRSEEEKEEQLKKRYEPLRDIIKEALALENSGVEVEEEEEEHSTLIDPWRYVSKRRSKKKNSYLDIFNNKPRYHSSTDTLSGVEQCTVPMQEPKEELAEPPPGGSKNIEESLLRTVPMKDAKEEQVEPLAGGSNTQESLLRFLSSTPEVKVPPNYGQYASKYVKNKINSEAGFDNVYGVQYRGTPERFTLGDSYVTFKDDMVEIGEDMKIGCTPGLLELLFMENPDKKLIRSHDLSSYRKILEETKAHRKRFSSTEEYHIQPKHPKWPIIRQLYSSNKGVSDKSKSDSSN